MKDKLLYRFFPLLCALALLLCCLPALAVPATAEEVCTGFTVSNISSSGNIKYFYSTADNLNNFKSILYNAYFNSSVVIVGCDAYYMYGYYWTTEGMLYAGCFVNPTGVRNASVLSVYSLTELDQVNSYHLDTENVYFSKALAETQSDFLTGEYYAVDWTAVESKVTSLYLSLYEKSSSATIWDTESAAYDCKLLGNVFSSYIDTAYKPTSADVITWTYSGIEPSSPTVTTSFNGLSISMTDEDEINFFILAENINGTPSVDWYYMLMPGGNVDELLSEDISVGNWTYYDTFHFVEASDGSYYNAWKYTPDADAAPYRILWKAIVHNALDGKVATYDPYDGVVVTVNSVTNGSYEDPSDPTVPDTGTTNPSDPTTGDDSTGSSGELEEIETSLGEVKSEIENLSGALGDLNSGGQAGENLGNAGDGLDDSNDELGGAMGDYNDALDQVPTVGDDIEDQIQDNLSGFDDSVLSDLMPWYDEEYADFWDVMVIPPVSSLSVSLLLYFVFGKANLR